MRHELAIFFLALGLSVVLALPSCSPTTQTTADAGITKDVVPDANPNALPKAELQCVPNKNTSSIPKSASEYVKMCQQHGLGVVPTVDCGKGVRIPIKVKGQEVFQTPKSCDQTSRLKPSCDVGSKIGRVQGKDAKGNPLPDVFWIYFCRAAYKTEYSSVQIIGYHKKTGATCFIEAADGKGLSQAKWLRRDDKNGLTGKMPGPNDPAFDQAFTPPPPGVQCVQCHQNDPFIRNPWIDGAKMPNNPKETVIPPMGANSSYYVVGAANWDMRTIHIKGNSCLGCHRIGMETDSIFRGNGLDANKHMPPQNPGSMAKDYQKLLECWKNGPENTPGCEWVIPPAGNCKGGVVGKEYPHKATGFNKGSGGEKKPGGVKFDPECWKGCEKKGVSADVCEQFCGKKLSPTDCYYACIKSGEDAKKCKVDCKFKP